MKTLGPISTALEAELRQRVKQNGIVIWLDRDGHYSQLVDQLQAQRADGELPYAVHGFRGSHLALMLELDAVAAGSDPPRLLIHLPGFTEDTVKETPLLGLYRSGVRYRKALVTLIREAATGQVPGEKVEEFMASEPGTLAMADGWLQAQLQADGGGLYEQIRFSPVVEVFEELLCGGPLCRQINSADVRDQFLRAMEASLALPRNWQRPGALPTPEAAATDDLGAAISNAVISALAQVDFEPTHWEAGRPASKQQLDDLAFIVASWALVVEYVHDLKRAPRGAAAKAAKVIAARLLDQPGCPALGSSLWTGWGVELALILLPPLLRCRHLKCLGARFTYPPAVGTTGRHHRQNWVIASPRCCLPAPSPPSRTAKIAGLQATVLLLLTCLIKARIQIKAASVLGLFLLALQTLVFLAVRGALGLAALGGVTFALNRRQAQAA